jgi:AcrR family transcriptional regulator
LRTRDIAKLVGINSATLHHHFPKKKISLRASRITLKTAFVQRRFNQWKAKAPWMLVARKWAFADADPNGVSEEAFCDLRSAKELGAQHVVFA